MRRCEASTNPEHALYAGTGAGVVVTMLRTSLMLALLVMALPAAAAHHPPCPPVECILAVPPPEVPFIAGLDLASFSARVEAADGLAKTTLEITVANPGNATGETQLSIPMPAGGALQAFNLTIAGQLIEGTVQEKGSAQQQYDDAKAEGRAAALLRHTAENLVSLAVTIPANGSGILRARYVEWVPVASGDLVYRLPLSQLALEGAPASVHVQVAERGGFTNLRSPSGLTFDNTAGTIGAADLAVSSQPRLPDLVVAWTPSTSGWRSTLLAAGPAGPGATAVPAIARLCLSEGIVLARDVVFVLDRSGSMAGSKMVQARAALQEALRGLGPDDRYNVVAFDNLIEPFGHGMVEGSAANTASDVAAVGGLEVRGGTDINGALLAALQQLNGMPASDRQPEVVFVTDGLPTSGVSHHGTIVANVRNANTRHAPIYAIPIGPDADAQFLEDLAIESGGFVTPLASNDARLAERLARVYDTTAHLVVGSVSVSTQQGRLIDPVVTAVAEDRCAEVALDLDLSGASVTLVLQGRDARGIMRQEFTFPSSAVPVEPDSRALYGRAAVGALLRQERATGVDLRASIVELAVATRQLTPYTAWVLAQPAPFARAGEPVDGVAATPAPSPSGGAVHAGRIQWSTAAPAVTPSVTPVMTPAVAPTSTIAPGEAPHDGQPQGTRAAQTPGLGVGLLAVALGALALAARRVARGGLR